MRDATVSGVSGSGSAHIDDSEDHGLVAEVVEVVRSRLGWAASIEVCSIFEAVSSGKNA